MSSLQGPLTEHTPFSCGQYPDSCCAACFGIVEDDVERGRRERDGVPNCVTCGRYLPLNGGCTRGCERRFA